MGITVNMKKTAMWLLAAASVWASASLPLQAQAPVSYTHLTLPTMDAV